MNGIIENNKTITGLATIQSDIVTSNIFYTTDGMNVENAINTLSVGITSYENTTNSSLSGIQTQINNIVAYDASTIQTQINDIVSYDTNNTTTTNGLQTQINSIVSYDTSNTMTINNLQNQINGITSTSTPGGGYFTVVCERVGYGTLNSPFGFGAGIYNTAEIVLPSCTLTMSRITASAPMTSGTSYFQFYKNGVGTGISTILTSPASTGQYTHSISFSSGDTFKILALNSGGFGTNNATVQIRINCVFTSAGIKGADGVSPTLTLGSVSTLSAGSNATIINAGTSTNQIYNFGIPRGIDGINGTTPLITIGAVNTLNLSSLATVTISGSISNPIFNFGIPISTTTIGSTATLPYGSSATLTNSGTSSNPILNFGIPRGADGTNATQKGDKGDKGDPGKDLSVQVDLNTAGLVTLGGIVAGIGANVVANNAHLLTIDGTLTTIAGEITTINATLGDDSVRIQTLENNVDNSILPKLVYVNKSTDATQIRGKTQMTDSIGYYDVINDPLLKTKLYRPMAEFDGDGNTITLGKTSSTVNVDGATILIARHAGATVDLGEYDSHVNIEGQTINIAQNTGATLDLGTYDSFVNIEGQTINMGYHAIGSSNIINLEASVINVGTVGYATTVNIGNVLSYVNISSVAGSAVKVSNFMDQFG